MNIGDTYHNTCNDQPSTWTITNLEGDKVTVYSPQSDRSYTISGVIFKDTMRALGFELVEEKPAKYRIYYPKFNAFYPIEFDTFNDALVTGQLKNRGLFSIKLGNMVCATWDFVNEVRFTEEYKSWYQDQERMLAQREGSYP